MTSKGKGGDSKADTTTMYVELSKLQQCGDHEKAVRVCNKILNSCPKDETAFHCKMVNLLQLGKFKEALLQMDTQAALAEMVDLSFEKAYCLYKENRYSDALAVLDLAGSSTALKHKELRAQIFYRMERYKECMSVYRDIIKNTAVGDDDFEVERMTNLAAVVVHLNAAGENAQLGPEASSGGDSYEMTYNKACCLLANGQFKEAEDLLKAAEKNCLDFLKKEANDEELDQEEVDQETGIIRAQRAYAIQKQGLADREKEAQTIYNSVLKSKPSDIGLVAVASNNLIVINKDQNIFDSRKKIKAATVEGLENKLTKVQRSEIAMNNALLTMYTNQVDHCRGLVKGLVSNGALTQAEGDMIIAGAFSRSGRTKDAIDLVLLPGRTLVKDIERALIAAQILLEKGDKKEALVVLSALPDASKFRSGILSAMVTLFLALEDRAGAAQVLKAAVNYQQSNKGNETMSAVVWRKTAEFHLSGDEPSVAAHSLEELLKIEPNNLQTQAQLVLAYAKFDLSKALAVSKKLPKFSYQSSSVVDIDVLEESSFVSTKYAKAKKGGADGGPMSPKARSAVAVSDEAAAKKKKKPKKNKKRLPKNLNVEPDPERWLPKRERTGYRKPRKNRRKGEEKFVGAQGSAVTGSAGADAFDYSNKKASVNASPQPGKSENAAAASAPPPGPRQQQRKPQPKKKGKSGKNRF